MALNRFTPGPCSCDCDEACTIKLHTFDLCSSGNLPNRDFRVFDAAHSVVASGTTDGSGYYHLSTDNIHFGSGYNVVTKAGTAYFNNLSCSGVFQIPDASGVARTITERGCGNLPIPGGSIIVRKVGDPNYWYTATASSSGVVSWVPSAGSGTYQLIYNVPGFASTTGVITVTNPCAGGSNTGSLSAASGYTCCAAKTGLTAKLPFSVALAGGGGFTGTVAEACNITNKCVTTLVGDCSVSPKVTVSCSGGCSFTTPPTDLAPSNANVMCSVTAGGANLFQASVSMIYNQNTKRTTQTDCSNCNSLGPFTDYKQWFVPTDCSSINSGYSGGSGLYGIWNSTHSVINSVNPVSVTCYFNTSLPNPSPVSDLTITAAG